MIYSTGFPSLLHAPSPRPPSLVQAIPGPASSPLAGVDSNITVGAILLHSFMFSQSTYHHLSYSVLLLIYLIPCLSPSTRFKAPKMRILSVLFAGGPSVPGTSSGHRSCSITILFMNEMAVSLTCHWTS